MISAPLLGKGDEAFALGRWWQQFLDAEVEDAFQRYALPLHAVALQRMLIVGGLGWLGFSANDWLMGGTAMLATSLPLRLASAAACFGMSWWLRRDDLDARTIGRIATAASVVCLGGIAWMLYLAPATGLPLAMLAAMVTIAVYLLIPNRLSRALLIAMAANVAFLAVAARLGTFTPVALAAVAVVQAGVNVFGFIVAQDIQRTWRREFQAYVGQQRVAVHDHLTGCLNRRYLSEQLLPAEIERASRYKTWLSVIVCDADHFKAVNDRHGHPTGDAVLRALAAQLLAGTRRGVDGVVRFGGEEFLLLLPSTDEASAVQTAERLRAAIAAMPVANEDGTPVPVTASFGVCGVDFGAQPATARAMIVAADQALYRAKHAGRNTVRTASVLEGAGAVA